MNFHIPALAETFEAQRADPRPTVVAALGDGLIGPIVHAFSSPGGKRRALDQSRFLTWLRIIMPGLDLAEDAVCGRSGDMTTGAAARVFEITDRHPRPAAALICVGMQDCLATITGVAPSAGETIAALEAIAAQLLSSGVVPAFIVPPPCRQFSNGLFADRYVTIAATLRRMSRQDRRIILVDPTELLADRSAFGIEPDARYAAAGADGRLSELGALRLAECVAERLRGVVGQAGTEAAWRRGFEGVVNDNPSLSGEGGIVPSDAAEGRCASGYRLEGHQTGGARIEAQAAADQPSRASQRLSFSGRYTTTWGFVRLSQDVALQNLDPLDEGDVIEAFCDVELKGEIQSIAAVAVHATPVWTTDFVGLHSQNYAGGDGVAVPFRGRLRTPRFRLPEKPTRLHVSLSVHLTPGEQRAVQGEIGIQALAVRKVGG
jgi:hypothetical protein